MVDSNFSLDSKCYKFISLVGKGSFSKVYQAECLTNNKQVAIKVMDLESISTSFEDILQEVQTMKLSDHNNILRCYCSFVESNQLWLVMQLMDLGSCLRVMNLAKLQLQQGEGLKEEWIGYILNETVSGLQYLHSNGQIHRDIKSGNILIDSKGGIRLADFGVSGWTVARGLRQDTVKTFVGTPCYMAPEVMEQVEGYDNKADIWSVGITALELAKGYAPYAHHSPMRVLVLTIEEEPPSLRCYHNHLQRDNITPFSSLFEDFYKKCLQKNPKTRPSADELLRHKFLKNNSNSSSSHHRNNICNNSSNSSSTSNNSSTANRVKEELIDQLLSHLSPVGSDYDSSTATATAAIGDDESNSLYNTALQQQPSSSNTTAIDKVDKNENRLSIEQQQNQQWNYDTGKSSESKRTVNSSYRNNSCSDSQQQWRQHQLNSFNNNNTSETQTAQQYAAGTSWVFDDDKDDDDDDDVNYNTIDNKNDGDGSGTSGVSGRTRHSSGSNSNNTNNNTINKNVHISSDDRTYNRQTASGIHLIKQNQIQQQSNNNYNNNNNNNKLQQPWSQQQQPVVDAIDDFLSDFEKEFVLQSSSSSSSSSSVMTKTATITTTTTSNIDNEINRKDDDHDNTIVVRNRIADIIITNQQQQDQQDQQKQKQQEPDDQQQSTSSVASFMDEMEELIDE